MVVISKKLGQLKQWTGEKMGKIEKTTPPEEWRKLDVETEGRKLGVERLTTSFTDLAKNLDKRSSMNKGLTVLGMVSKAMDYQGNYYGDDSEYGKILQKVSESQELLNVCQNFYVESLKRDLLFEYSTLNEAMKEHATLKKKLEFRRLDYDAKSNKLSKATKPKPRLEEETREAKEKYEQTLGDLEERMSSYAGLEERILQSVLEFTKAQEEYYRDGLKVCENLQKTLKSSTSKTSKNVKQTVLPTTTLNRKPSLNSKTISLNPPKSGVDSLADGNGGYGGGGGDYGVSEVEEGSSSAAAATASKATVIAAAAATATASSTSSNAWKEDVEELVEASFPFEGGVDGELGMKKGDVIRVTNKIDEGWWFGRKESDGKEGMFPSNYVVPHKKGGGGTSSSSSSSSGLGSISSSFKAPSIDLSGVKEKAQIAKDGAKLAGGLGAIALTAGDGGKVGGAKAALSAGKLMGKKENRKIIKEVNTIASSMSCKECQCEEFSANVFKQGQCNNCFHQHN